MVEGAGNPVVTFSVAIVQRVQPLPDDGAAEAEYHPAQVLFRPAQVGDDEEDEDAADDLGELVDPEEPGIAEQDVECTVADEHQEQQERPGQVERSSCVSLQQEQKEDEVEHIDVPDLDAPGGAPVPGPAEKVDIHQLRIEGGEEEEQDRQFFQPG